jgi:hypothetical protein
MLALQLPLSFVVKSDAFFFQISNTSIWEKDVERGYEFHNLFRLAVPLPSWQSPLPEPEGQALLVLREGVGAEQRRNESCYCPFCGALRTCSPQETTFIP